MATWRQANRFPGDALLLSDDAKSAFDCDVGGWRERSTGTPISAKGLLDLVGDQHRGFIQTTMARAQLRSAQLVAAEAAALLLERGTLSAFLRRQKELCRLTHELREISGQR